MAFFKFVKTDSLHRGEEFVPFEVAVMINTDKISKVEYCPSRNRIDIYEGDRLLDTISSEDAKELRKVHFSLLRVMDGTGNAAEDRSLNLCDLRKD